MRYNTDMPLKVEIIRVYIDHLVYENLSNMAMNLDVAFVLSVSICMSLIMYFGLTRPLCFKFLLTD